MGNIGAGKGITRLPRSREEALTRGVKYYRTGDPCKKGHDDKRWTTNGKCVACSRARDATRRGSPWRWAQLAHGRCRFRAEQSGLPFGIDIEDIHGALVDNDFRCPVFGVKLRTKGRVGRTGGNSASVDRLVPDKGYVKGNITVLSMRANRIKNAYTSADILAVGRWLEKQGY